MEITKTIGSTWQPALQLVETTISGDVNIDDIQEWEQSLQETLDQIPDGATFKIFVNLHGFKAVNLDAHKRFRTIIPLTLASYGWRVGYLGLFEQEAERITYTFNRGIRCLAAAHSHHDASKMSLYRDRFAHERENYFTDPTEAREWILRSQI